MRYIVILSALLIASVQTFGQGTIWFLNRVVGVVDSPVYYLDGITKLFGDGFLAQLYAGPTPSALEPIGTPIPFRTGTGAGYLATSGIDPTREIPTVPIGSTAWIEVHAWEVATGSRWESAWIRGASPLFSQITGGIPPKWPTVLSGLQSFRLQIVPEASVLAFLFLGGLLLASKRWRQKE